MGDSLHALHLQRLKRTCILRIRNTASIQASPVTRLDVLTSRVRSSARITAPQPACRTRTPSKPKVP